MLTCGFRRSYDTFTQVLGSEGQLHLTNPFHPGPGDTLTLHRPGRSRSSEHPTTDEHSFTAALRHIHAALRGEAAPEQLARTRRWPRRATLEAVKAACGL